MFDHLLESSHRDDSNKWTNIGFGEELKQQIEAYYTHLIWDSAALHVFLKNIAKIKLVQVGTNRFSWQAFCIPECTLLQMHQW